MADGSIKISIEVDGRQITIASNDLDRLEEAARRAGSTASIVERGMDNISDSSTQASSSIRGADNALEDLGESGATAGQSLRGAEGSLDNLADSSADASSNLRDTTDNLSDMAGQAQNAGNETGRASIGIKELATSLGLVAIGAAVFNELKNSMDAAITRFDTLNKFPKVLQALGVSAEDSERAMSRLSEGIDGLPTTLNEIAGSAQRMYTSFNDMDKATDSAIALNNALLGSGSSAADAARGSEQYIKALQTGKMEMDSWNTLQETMDIGLIKIAEGFGFAGKTAKQDLYNALKDGVITMEEFNDKLIEVGTGTGIMAKLAKENSLGIATSIGNLKNAAARGIANIIDSFNQLTIAVTGKDIAQNIDSLKAVVNQSFKVIQSVIEGATPFVVAFGSAVGAVIPVVQALTPAIIGLVAAYGAYVVITKATAAINSAKVAIAAATATTQALTIGTRAQIAAQVTMTTVDRAGTVATVASTSAISLKTFAIGVMTRTIKLSNAAQIIATTTTKAWAAAMALLRGPIGWVTAGLAVLTTGIIAVVKWFNKQTEESKRLNAETEKLNDSTKSLNDNLLNTETTYKNNQKEILAAAKANGELAQKVEELAAKEKKSAEDKALLNSYIQQLNGSVEGLNLAYNEEANALNMTSEQLAARLNLMKETENQQAAEERLTEIFKEQQEVQLQLDEINNLRDEWNKKLEEGTVKSGEHKEALAGLEEQENSLKESISGLMAEQVLAEDQIKKSSAAIAEAVKAGVSSQKLDYESLSEVQKETVDNMKTTWDDYKAAATDMFDTISTKSEVSVSEMTKNLEKNQKVISDWADNIAKLAERGVDEGLLNTLREAGPESAGHVNALVKASDTELQKLSEAFAKGGEVATSALSKSLGIEESNLMDAVSNLVVDTEKSLREQIKSADFESIGIAIPDGTAKGVTKGTKNAEKATKKMAEDTTRAAKHTLGVNSPSKVFTDIGTNITEGLVLGINGGTTSVINAVERMFRAVIDASNRDLKLITKSHDDSVKLIEQSLNKLPVVTQETMQNMLERMKSGATNQINLMKNLARDIVSQFNKLPSDLRSVGINSMNGLNSGLLAGKGKVLATARSIANEVARTMQQALDINSPSRVMRNDVGRWIPEGIALGIRDNAKSVYREIDEMANKMIISTPEKALSVGRMAYSTGSSINGGSITSHYDHSRKMENHITIKTDDSAAKEVDRTLRRLKLGYA
ncbi:tape measure protein [Robertmurraya siralis]|uniref:tape measure protein n=1 Tax=Robertmurraya siralis TaxID=77777 RepID=UPI0010F555CF|nr:tape measure protein [Robertmurraya siralis]